MNSLHAFYVVIRKIEHCTRGADYDDCQFVSFKVIRTYSTISPQSHTRRAGLRETDHCHP